MVKTTILGPEPGQEREARILNLLLAKCLENGVYYEAGPRHAQRIVKDTEMEAKTPLSSPGVKVYQQKERRGTTAGVGNQDRQVGLTL